MCYHQNKMIVDINVAKREQWLGMDTIWNCHDCYKINFATVAMLITTNMSTSMQDVSLGC